MIVRFVLISAIARLLRQVRPFTNSSLNAYTYIYADLLHVEYVCTRENTDPADHPGTASTDLVPAT